MRWGKKADEIRNAASTGAEHLKESVRAVLPPQSLERARAALEEGGGILRSALSSEAALGRGAAGALAVGALALGAVAVGAFAIGRLSVGKARIGEARIGEAEIGRLRIGRLEIDEVERPPLPGLRYLSRRTRW